MRSGRFSNSEISNISMDGLKLKITMVIFILAGPTVLIILNSYLLLSIGFLLGHQNRHDGIK